MRDHYLLRECYRRFFSWMNSVGSKLHILWNFCTQFQCVFCISAMQLFYLKRIDLIAVALCRKKRSHETKLLTYHNDVFFFQSITLYIRLYRSHIQNRIHIIPSPSHNGDHEEDTIKINPDRCKPESIFVSSQYSLPLPKLLWGFFRNTYLKDEHGDNCHKHKIMK